MAIIRQLAAADLDAFMVHVEQQAAENGRGRTVRFALREPGKPRDANRLRKAISDGLERPFGDPGWFRVWIADEAGAIVGHVGLRAPGEPLSSHRAFVDVGVLEPYRGRGIARRLYGAAIAWARGQAGLAWLDAEVFAHNQPALSLHRRLGFVETARIADLFRFDGAPVDDVRLCLPLRHAEANDVTLGDDRAVPGTARDPPDRC
jgi:RimJ/RimL family protein N-acetyltransferase